MREFSSVAESCEGDVWLWHAKHLLEITVERNLSFFSIKWGETGYIWIIDFFIDPLGENVVWTAASQYISELLTGFQFLFKATATRTVAWQDWEVKHYSFEAQLAGFLLQSGFANLKLGFRWASICNVGIETGLPGWKPAILNTTFLLPLSTKKTIQEGGRSISSINSSPAGHWFNPRTLTPGP